MKKIHFHFFYAAILAFILLIGCSSDKNDNPVNPGNPTNSEARLTLNGGPFVNQSVTLSNGVSTYSVTDTATAVQFIGTVNADSLIMLIVFRGNQTGNINWDNDNGVILYKNGTSGLSTFIGVSQGSTTISSYGSIGGKVDGSVSGKLVDAATQAEVNVSGNFSATRIQDIN